MRKFFRFLAAAALVSASLAATSCSDDPEEPVVKPEFPTPPTAAQVIVPGEAASFQISPNMDWSLSIPDDARSWFALDDNGTDVSTLHGSAGDYTITIKTADATPFDEEPEVKVTMTMGDPAEESVVAWFVIKQVARELKFYNVKYEEDGSFSYNEDPESSFTFAYDTENPLKEGAAKLEQHGGIFFNARVLVEANAAWVLAGLPEWIDVKINREDANGAAAGQYEVEFRANNATMPTNGEEATAKFLATNEEKTELATITLSIESIADLLECEFTPNAAFSPAGNYLASASTVGKTFNSYITSTEGAKIIIAQKSDWGYDECYWATAEIDEWSEGEKIQTRKVAISVNAQSANGTVREAAVFALPASMSEATLETLLTEDWSGIKEEYAQYQVTTLSQEASTQLFSAHNSLSMKKNGVTFQFDWEMFDPILGQWCDWMQNGNEYYYKLTYSNEWSADGGELDVNNIRGINGYASYKIYGYNAGSAGENLPADNQWITLEETRNETTQQVESFTVHMNFDQEYVNYYGDGLKYAAIVFYDEDNEAIATLECEYNEDGSGDEGTTTSAVCFSYPEYAAMEGSSIKQLAAGDADYDKYASAYADFEPSVYEVTFSTTDHTISQIKGLPDYGQWCEVIDNTDLLSVPEPAENVRIRLNGTTSATGALIFYQSGSSIDANGKVVDPTGPAIILVVKLVL